MVFTLLIAAAAYCVGTPAMAAEGKCTSVQAQCALEIGGYCNPKTGYWCYGYWMSRRCGGGNTHAFDECLSRKLGQRK
jgi:hypothetical protein